MPGIRDKQHSILIVSTSEQFDRIVKRSLVGYITIDTRKSAAMARRCILERNYDLVVINSPVPDESGEAFALFVTEQSNASVLLVTPHDLYEQVMDRLTDYGILVMAKPFPYGQTNKAIRFLTAVQNRMGSLAEQTQTLEEKMEEIRIISRAKLLLVEKQGMTEDAAHRFIGKQAMDQGVSRRRIARKLIWSLGKD